MSCRNSMVPLAPFSTDMKKYLLGFVDHRNQYAVDWQRRFREKLYEQKRSQRRTIGPSLIKLEFHGPPDPKIKGTGGRYIDVHRCCSCGDPLSLSGFDIKVMRDDDDTLFISGALRSHFWSPEVKVSDFFEVGCGCAESFSCICENCLIDISRGEEVRCCDCGSTLTSASIESICEIQGPGLYSITDGDDGDDLEWHDFEDAETDVIDTLKKLTGRVGGVRGMLSQNFGVRRALELLAIFFGYPSLRTNGGDLFDVASFGYPGRYGFPVTTYNDYRQRPDDLYTNPIYLQQHRRAIELWKHGEEVDEKKEHFESTNVSESRLMQLRPRDLDNTMLMSQRGRVSCSRFGACRILAIVAEYSGMPLAHARISQPVMELGVDTPNWSRL